MEVKHQGGKKLIKITGYENYEPRSMKLIEFRVRNFWIRGTKLVYQGYEVYDTRGIKLKHNLKSNLRNLQKWFKSPPSSHNQSSTHWTMLFPFKHLKHIRTQHVDAKFTILFGNKKKSSKFFFRFRLFFFL